ncbi:MAG: hypothetical protein EDQ89_00415 [Acidobacteria bacterium]|nr:MAG: hypothetical protein EDQ89_00415 [Acidobacteriota bacterium]
MDEARLRTYDVATALVAIRAKLVPILLAGVGLGLIGLIYALSLQGTFKAEAVIYPRVPAFSDDAFDPRVLVDTVPDPLTSYAELADLDQIARETSRALGGTPDPIEVDEDVTIKSTGGLISIEAEAESPELAAELANTYARAAIASRRRAAISDVDRVQRNLQANLQDAPRGSPQARDLQRRIDDLNAYRDFQTGNTEQAQKAVAPAASGGRPIVSSTIGGAVAGVLIAIAAVLIADRIRPRIRDRRSAEAAFGAPVLTTITGDGDRAAVETLRAKLLTRPGHDPPRTLVLAPLENEPADRVARRLVAAVALSGRRAISIDADLASAGNPPGPGLAEVLEGEASRVAVTAALADNADSMGPGESARGVGDTAALLHRPAMKALLDDLTSTYELIVMTVPSPVASADAIPLVGEAEVTLAVVALGSLESDCRALAEEVRSVTGSLRGVVLVES